METELAATAEDRYKLEKNVVQKKTRELLDSAAALTESERRRGGAKTAREHTAGELVADKMARVAAEVERDELRAEVLGLWKLGRRAWRLSRELYAIRLAVRVEGYLKYALDRCTSSLYQML